MNVNPIAITTSATIKYASAIAGPRPTRPRRSIQDTNGSSASARKSETSSHVITSRAIQTSSRNTATAIVTPRTRKIVRVRTSTTRSAVTSQGWRVGRTVPLLRWLPVRFSERRGWTSAAVLAGYVLVAFAYWGVRLLPHPGRYLIGSGSDPQIFVWSFGWWRHALAHALNPIHTHVIWAPLGYNLAWT